MSNSLRELSDERFETQCRWEAFRGPGPGGQKRNKTSSAVRVTHVASGVSVVATEMRSQAANRKNALRRLRHRLTLERREEIDPVSFRAPRWFTELIAERGRLKVGERDGRYLPVMGLVLDVLAATGWSVSQSAELLGVSSGGLSGFLEKDDQLWAHVSRQRSGAGLRPLLRN
jgi:hypothetical protein